jgi:hypothetical protein
MDDCQRRKALEAAEIDMMECRVVVVPAKDWARFKAWAARPAREIAGLKETLQQTANMAKVGTRGPP